MSYIDIKSEGLRDILREALHGIKAVSLMEDKQSVIIINTIFEGNSLHEFRSSSMYYFISSQSLTNMRKA